jgi:ketosteroid isomerase-like protein
MGHGDVLAAERSLQAAQRASDVEALDRLLHPDLLAVGPDGQLADKASDLAAHRQGIFQIDELHEEDLRVLQHGDGTAVTFVVVRLRGSIAGDEVSGRVRYTRTWVRGESGWQVLAAHIAPLP